MWGQGLAIVSLWLPGPEARLPRGNHLPWEFPEIFAACLWWYLHPVAAVVGVGPEDKDVNFDKKGMAQARQDQPARLRIVGEK